MADFIPQALTVPERSALLTALVAPRPIAFVSTLGTDGVGNLAPFSFFMAGGYNPMSVAFAPLHWRDGGIKDTLTNVRETGEFVVNVTTADMAARVNQASYRYAHGIDEFDAVGFTRVPSVVVRPPRVAESVASLECRVFQIVEHGNGPGSGAYVIGEVLRIHVNDAVLTNGVPDNHKIEHLARLGADVFARMAPGVLFNVTRPTGP